jgi:hypothetical protein
MPQSHRAVAATFFAAAAGLLLFAVLFLWPGYLAITHCDPSRIPTVTVGGHTYCYVSATVQPVRLHYPPSCTNESQVLSGPVESVAIWGYSFRLSSVYWCSATYGGLNFTVSEPNGTTVQHYALYSAPFPHAITWVTPDNESGFIVPAQGTPVTLLVEASSR